MYRRSRGAASCGVGRFRSWNRGERGSLPHRSKQSDSVAPSTSTGQSQLWKWTNAGRRVGRYWTVVATKVDKMPVGYANVMVGGVEARNPSRSLVQSPSSSSAGGLGAASGPGRLTPKVGAAIIRAGMRRPRLIVSRCSADCAVVWRLVDGLRANSFTSLRSAATHRTAALATECAQSQRGIRPLIALRRDAGCYKRSFFRPLPVPSEGRGEWNGWTIWPWAAAWRSLDAAGARWNPAGCLSLQGRLVRR